MYIHLGSDTVIRACDVVGIFDIEKATVRETTKAYLNHAQRVGNVVDVSPELPKSFVVCNGKKGETVYISQISSITLKKRAGAASKQTGGRGNNWLLTGGI